MMNTTFDVSGNDLYKINFHIREALRRGEHVCIEDSHAAFWSFIGVEPAYYDAWIMFQLFEDVFEEFPVSYVFGLVAFDAYRPIDTLNFCTEYWERTRGWQKAWPL